MRLTKLSRDHYHFSSDFFSDDGRARFEDFASARKFAAQVTALRSQPLPASDLYALSLIDEALRALVKRFAPPPVMTTAMYAEYERTAQTKSGCRILVLLAKNTYVWLDQLSKTISTQITTLEI
jgi:hypothetical protein